MLFFAVGVVKIWCSWFVVLVYSKLCVCVCVQGCAFVSVLRGVCVCRCSSECVFVTAKTETDKDTDRPQGKTEKSKSKSKSKKEKKKKKKTRENFPCCDIVRIDRLIATLLIQWIAWCMAVLSWWRHLSGSCRLCVRSEREREREREKMKMKLKMERQKRE